MLIVVIEWDGKQPPTTYYNGLHHLGLRVRTNDKNDAPIVRRSKREDHSVIVQEGAVLVESQSLARQVSYLAKENGARSVLIGECDFPDESQRQITDAELEVVHRFNRAFKQRGRPVAGSNDILDYVVTCPECVTTSTTSSSKVVIQCPECGGLRVSARVGSQHVFDHIPQTLVEWKDMSFAEGRFEVPRVDVLSKGEPIIHKDLNEDDLRVYENMQRSGTINEILSSPVHMKAYHELLNSVFCARRYYTEQDRQHQRTRMVVELLERGVDAASIPLIESKSEYDILDASIIKSDWNLIREFYLNNHR